jgi:hypothetical protein
MGSIGCPETSVQNYNSALRKIPEERKSNTYIYIYIDYVWTTAVNSYKYDDEKLSAYIHHVYFLRKLST